MFRVLIIAVVPVVLTVVLVNVQIPGLAPDQFPTPHCVMLGSHYRAMSYDCHDCPIVADRETLSIITCKGEKGSCDCKTNDGCRNFGEKWKDSCLTLKCISEGWKHECFILECKKTKSGWMVDPVRAECEDADGNCIQNGQLMTKVIDGKVNKNCRCSVSGLNSSYSCFG